MTEERHVVVAAVLHTGRRVLLCHRRPDRRWYPDVWDLPGGHVEEGETPRIALVRELGEELGIRIDPPDREPVAARELADGTNLTIWAIDRWQGRVVNLAPGEHDRLAWFRRSELATLDLADPAITEICHRVLDPGRPDSG